ncbi:hypothetical protein AVEN_100309-1 [Araneus ventricosus]|uniref:Uncharacterized protein n=2 Tax=Araneus ventricosus TaxID=182803 RepID=A0A4Y2UPG1_ARAVE|nr:hypothetical protein AVEN_100309-1 [Araneus ventricosus]
MFFQLQLNRFLPALTILVGNNGLMYVKLVEIGTLLSKKNPYMYRTQLKHLAVQGMDVLPQAGYDIPQKTLLVHVVPIFLAYRLLMEENIELGQLFLKRLREGFAHKHGMRKFVVNERKAPLLVCVDVKDEKCVSVPEWIDEFIRDLQLQRQEVQKHSVPSAGPSTSGQQTTARVAPKRKCLKTFLQQCKKPRTDESGDESTSPVSSSDVKPEEFFVDPTIKSEPQDSSRMETSGEIPEPTPNIKLEPISMDSTPESPNEPTPVPISVDPTPELPNESTPVEPIPESPEEPTTSESPVEPTPERKIHPIPVALVDLSKISFVPAMGIFPEPGDLIVKFHKPPPRVFFIQGDGDGMYWMNIKRDE